MTSSTVDTASASVGSVQTLVSGLDNFVRTLVLKRISWQQRGVTVLVNKMSFNVCV
jgi:hypothetical protein